jgi:aspartate carbamoyltransferase catalytic subunit
MPSKHILQSQDFTIPWLENLFTLTDRLKYAYLQDDQQRIELTKLLNGKIMFAIFGEPSTRTRFSFVMAAERLGMRAQWTEDASKFSSAVKGEICEHSARVLLSYRPDVFVIRHSVEGAAEIAARASDEYFGGIPVINAGDGEGQHPTQALADIYTIVKDKKQLDNLTVLMGGDLLRGRTCHSLAYLLSKYRGIRFIFVSPPELAMKESVLSYLKEHKIPFLIETSPQNALPHADVIYWTRTQSERGNISLCPKSTETYTIGLPEIKLMKEDAILLHPMPINGEITREVDRDPKALYFEQAENGLYIRMAILCDLFSVKP